MFSKHDRVLKELTNINKGIKIADQHAIRREKLKKEFELTPDILARVAKRKADENAKSEVQQKKLCKENERRNERVQMRKRKVQDVSKAATKNDVKELAAQSTLMTQLVTDGLIKNAAPLQEIKRRYLGQRNPSELTFIEETRKWSSKAVVYTKLPLAQLFGRVFFPRGYTVVYSAKSVIGTDPEVVAGTGEDKMTLILQGDLRYMNSPSRMNLSEISPARQTPLYNYHTLRLF